MGLTNYIKNKLEKHPHTTQALNATKQGATKVYNASQKAINSPKLDTIGRAAQGIGYGIEQGAGQFNSSLGFGDKDDFNFNLGADFNNVELKDKPEHRYESKRQRRNRREREHQEHRHNRDHERREGNIGDLF